MIMVSKKRKKGETTDMPKCTCRKSDNIGYHSNEKLVSYCLPSCPSYCLGGHYSIFPCNQRCRGNGDLVANVDDFCVTSQYDVETCDAIDYDSV